MLDSIRESIRKLEEQVESKRSLARPKTTDYTAIYHNAQGTLTDADLSQIAVLIWELHKNTENTCMVVDAQTGAVYFGEGYFLDACSQDHKVADLKDTDMAAIVGHLTDSGITGWKNKYVGTSEGTTGHYAWGIGIRLQDGRCVSYTGSGVLNSGTPAAMRSLLEALAAQFSG